MRPAACCTALTGTQGVLVNHVRMRLTEGLTPRLIWYEARTTETQSRDEL